MKLHLRILITGMIALCVSISSFAGAKKCYKTYSNTNYHLSVLQKPGGHEGDESNSSNEVHCSAVYLIIDSREEKQCISRPPESDYVIADFTSQGQDCPNPPFAPPRFV